MTAESGSMLVLLYSDTNYVMSGFSARYAASACPGACSGHGKCDPARGTCSCAEGFTGADCGVETCPGSCGAAAGWGWCQGGRCECNPGFVGDDCSLNVEVLVVHPRPQTSLKSTLKNVVSYKCCMLPSRSKL